MKYFPSLSLMTRALRIGVDDFNRHKMTLVSTKVLRKLIEAALEGVEFDEKWYLKQYGDIADAHRKGQIVNLREHFITSGYFEGRRPSGRHFDARWYVSTNKDVADALRQGRSEEHTSELQSLMRISYAVFCLKKKKVPTKCINLNYKTDQRHLR